ncbi:unnamed protein product [Oikopleura dioica]|uniref:Uncharacterized protein n=1 Tax=Oikopleura dioica TaxID=34765 RepID=E4XMC0_OIKDI|nr:unnamed protein product [Oikopleura dioica]
MRNTTSEIALCSGICLLFAAFVLHTVSYQHKCWITDKSDDNESLYSRCLGMRKCLWYSCNHGTSLCRKWATGNIITTNLPRWVLAGRILLGSSQILLAIIFTLSVFSLECVLLFSLKIKTKKTIAKYVLGTTIFCFLCELITAIMVVIMISVDVVKDQGNRDWARGLTLCMYSCVLTFLAAVAQAVALRFFESSISTTDHEFSPTPEKKIIPVFQHPLGVPLRESPKLQPSTLGNIRMTSLPYASPYEPKTSAIPRVVSPISTSSLSSSSSRSTLPKALRNVTERRRISDQYHRQATKDFTGFINKSYNG